MGARKSSICYNAVEGREKMKKEKKRKWNKVIIWEVVKCDKMKIWIFDKYYENKILMFYKIINILLTKSAPISLKLE